MIEHLLRWSLKNRPLILIAAAAMTLWGAFAAKRMPVDVFPDLSAPTVTVLTEAHGMAPREIEALVTFPIETALNGAYRVRRVRSSTSAGISVVWVEFEWGTDIYRARQIVSEKLGVLADAMPAEAGQPVLAPISSIMGEIMFLAMVSDRHTPMELRTAADWTVRPRLLSVSGVAQVTPIGGDVRQMQVLIDQRRMAERGVALEDVTAAAKNANVNASAGFLISGPQEYVLRGIGLVSDARELAETPVALRAGAPVLLSHVAEIKIGPALKRGDASYNARKAVVLGVQKQPDANTIDLTRRIEAALDEIQRSLPEGMEIRRDAFRQADFISVAIRNVLHALRDGTILVIVVLALFLGNIRSVLITLVAIPLSLIVSIAALILTGGTINTMTLGGLVIAIGSLVDDAIIDVENVMRRLKENARHPEKAKPVLDVVLSATLEIRPSIVFATAIIILVFLPLFFLSGVEGRLMQPLGFAFVTALAASLAVSLIVTPVLCSYLLPKAAQDEHDTRLMAWLKAHYARPLEWTLERPKLMGGVSAVLMLTALFAGADLGRSFLPEFNEGSLTIGASTLPGTSLAESDDIARGLEKILLTFPEVAALARRTGRAELDEHAQSVEYTEMEVSLKPDGHNRAGFLAELRADFAAVPGVSVVIGQPISHRIDHMLSGSRANLAIKIFGPDLAELRRLGALVERSVRGVDGLVDIALERQTEIPVKRVSFDRRRMARFGLTPGAAAEALETAFVGQKVSNIREGQKTFDLIVRYARVPDDPDGLGDILIDTPAGPKIPLRMVADIRRDLGPNRISRENVQRKIVVTANVAGRAVGDAVADAQQAVAAGVKLPPGYYVEYGGQFEAEQTASKRIAWLGALVIVGIALLLAAAFGSARDTFFIMLNLPLALIGGVAGVYATGAVLSVASLIGFITLFGIATRNGIMLISHIRHLMEEEGVTDLRQAVVRGSMERLAPILMTALTAFFALIPLALSAGKPGSEIQAPMAVVILFGLVTSTVLNMLVVPSLYYWVRRR